MLSTLTSVFNFKTSEILSWGNLIRLSNILKDVWFSKLREILISSTDSERFQNSFCIDSDTFLNQNKIQNQCTLVFSESVENSECTSVLPVNQNENQSFFSTLQRDKKFLIDFQPLSLVFKNSLILRIKKFFKADKNACKINGKFFCVSAGLRKSSDFHFDSEAIQECLFNFPRILRNSENTDSEFCSGSESIQKLFWNGSNSVLKNKVSLKLWWIRTDVFWALGTSTLF